MSVKAPSFSFGRASRKLANNMVSSWDEGTNDAFEEQIQKEYKTSSDNELTAITEDLPEQIEQQCATSCFTVEHSTSFLIAC